MKYQDCHLMVFLIIICTIYGSFNHILQLSIAINMSVSAIGV